LESRIIIKIESNKEAAITKEEQANNKIGEVDLLTLPRAKPAY
jgi:hypothetical protein